MSPEGEQAVMSGYDAAMRVVLDKELARLRARRIGTDAVRAAISNQVRPRRAA